MASLKKSKSTLVSYTPAGWWAETWREGLFCGNGKIGANIFGGAALEQILLNHSDYVKRSWNWGCRKRENINVVF